MIKQSLRNDGPSRLTNQPKVIGWHLLSTVNVGISRRHLASKLSEIILGGQDGLVNVAGVILGLAAATSDTRIIIAGGLAATFAESISMAAVAYTSALADMDYYRAEVARETDEIRHSPASKRQQVAEVFASWGFSGQLLEDAIDHITQDEKHWVEIVMAHELELQPVTETGVLPDAILVGLSAIVGSLVPLMPFFFMPPASAVWLGMALTAMVLFGVGAVKARLTVGQPGRSGVQMAVIGMVAALAGYAIGALFSQ
jgi:VIT1/CCC1 family predicted Fe2+/Mn2+ transporter